MTLINHRTIIQVEFLCRIIIKKLCKNNTCKNDKKNSQRNNFFKKIYLMDTI